MSIKQKSSSSIILDNYTISGSNIKISGKDISCSGIVVIEDQLIYHGEKYKIPYKINGSKNLSIIGDRIFINGYEFKPELGKFKKTLRGIFYKYF